MCVCVYIYIYIYIYIYSSEDSGSNMRGSLIRRHHVAPDHIPSQFYHSNLSYLYW